MYAENILTKLESIIIFAWKEKGKNMDTLSWVNVWFLLVTMGMISLIAGIIFTKKTKGTALFVLGAIIFCTSFILASSNKPRWMLSEKHERAAETANNQKATQPAKSLWREWEREQVLMATNAIAKIYRKEGLEVDEFNTLFFHGLPTRFLCLGAVEMGLDPSVVSNRLYRETRYLVLPLSITNFPSN